jgi:uncharacterized surface protein with fasciclin (FAS1) repeats
MKKQVLLALLLLNACTLFAQIQSAAPVTPDVSNVKPNTTTSAPVKTSRNKPAKLPSSNIIDELTQEKSFSKFFKALQVAGLTETFKSKGPITLFIPNDEAFGKISAGRLDTLFNPDHKPDLIALITYHAIAGTLSMKDINKKINSGKNAAFFITLSGGKLTVKKDADGNTVFVDENGGQSIISKTPAQPGNGSLFVLNKVLIPKNRLF